MASDTSLAHCLVLINKRAALLSMTLEAGFVSTQERKAAGSELLLNICGGALNGDALVRFMTIAATHLALEHRMMMRQLERRANFEVTLETRVRRLSRVDDRALSAASLNMQTSGTVAGLAPHIHRLLRSFAPAFCGTLSHNYLFCL